MHKHAPFAAISKSRYPFTNTMGNGRVDPDVLALAGGESQLVISTAEGPELVYVPSHLKDPQSWKGLPNATKRTKIQNVFGAAQPKRVRRFWVELKDIKMKSSIGGVPSFIDDYLRQFAKSKWDTIEHVPRVSEFDFSEGFSSLAHHLSDAGDEVDEMRLQIRVHAITGHDQVSTSSSMDNIATPQIKSRLSLLSNLRRSPTSSSMHQSQNVKAFHAGQLHDSGASTPTSMRPPLAASTNGQLLAESILAIPVQNGTKSTQEFSLTNIKGKEVARITICTGAIIDEEFNAVPVEHIPAEPEFADYLNFSLSTAAASVWRKYWCVLRDQEILVFDFEYREDKPEVARIPLILLQTVQPSNPEFVFAPCCIEFVFTRTTAPTSWLETVIGVQPTGELVGYATADSTERMNAWIGRISREKARIDHRRQPIPPPRKLTNGGKTLGMLTGNMLPGTKGTKEVKGAKGTPIKNVSLRKPVAPLGPVTLAREAGY
ncbi:hypothetical protein HDU85_003038 [Gaertneriomyces sp. JEL0708]|nr:hypothetical protein HDU85_003038 [Gaertneriomyces sp. JEL0708]